MAQTQHLTRYLITFNQLTDKDMMYLQLSSYSEQRESEWNIINALLDEFFTAKFAACLAVIPLRISWLTFKKWKNGKKLHLFL